MVTARVVLPKKLVECAGKSNLIDPLGVSTFFYDASPGSGRRTTSGTDRQGFHTKASTLAVLDGIIRQVTGRFPASDEQLAAPHVFRL